MISSAFVYTVLGFQSFAHPNHNFLAAQPEAGLLRTKFHYAQWPGKCAWNCSLHDANGRRDLILSEATLPALLGGNLNDLWICHCITECEDGNVTALEMLESHQCRSRLVCSPTRVTLTKKDNCYFGLVY